MFVVEIVSRHRHRPSGHATSSSGGPVAFDGAIAFWLWFTVIFANFAEAMAEGRGKAQAEALRRTRADLVARRLQSDGREETVPALELRAGDLVMVAAGELIPGDGDIEEGIASVDESAITGESAPVIRESGGDRSAVTAGTKVLSDWIKVRITADPGRVVPGPHDRPGRGRRASEDAQRDRAADPAGRSSRSSS